MTITEGEVELHFVALWKHDAPQCIVAGPYLHWEDAHAEAEKRSEPERAYPHKVMKTMPIAIHLCE